MLSLHFSSHLYSTVNVPTHCVKVEHFLFIEAEDMKLYVEHVLTVQYRLRTLNVNIIIFVGSGIFGLFLQYRSKSKQR